MLLSTAIDQYITSLAGARADATVKWYQNRLTTLLRYCGDRPVDQITIEDLESYRATIAKGHSPYTTHGHCRATRALWKWLRKRGHVPSNIALEVQLPRLPSNPPKHIARDDIARLLNVAKRTRDRAIILILASSGCRVGGLAHLTREEIDLEHGIILCHEKFDRANTYYLTKEAIAALRTWIEENPTGPLWTSNTGGSLTESGIYQILKRLAKRAGLEEHRWNPHAFRHQKARELLENGASLADVANILNHRDESVTARFYARWTNEEVHKRFQQFSQQTYETNGEDEK